MRFLTLAIFAATIPAANWMIGNVGECAPNGPCLIPVGFGLMAPSGVLMVGIALVARDMVQEWWGVRWAVAAIFAGAGASTLFASQELALASGVAFLVSEFADMAVYTPLRRKRLITAVLASQAVGSVVDSAAFLWLAFGALDFIGGQVVGKVGMGLLAVLVLLTVRRRSSSLFQRGAAQSSQSGGA